MPFQLENILNRGTSTPAVARTMAQGNSLIQVQKRTKEQEESATAILIALMKLLVRCVETHEPIAAAGSNARAAEADGSMAARQQGIALRPPSIPNLEGMAESFVQAAKLATAQATRLTVPFYGQNFGHTLNRLGKWAATLGCT